MKRLVRWCSKEAPNGDVPKYMIAVLGIDFTLWAISVVTIGAIALVQQQNGTLPEADSSFIDEMIRSLPIQPCGTLVEELMFRAPLSLVAKAKLPTLTVTCAIGLGLVFGCLHLINTPFPIIPTIAGLMWGFTYLKMGGMHGKVVKPLLVTWTLHFIHNLVLILGSMAILALTK